MKELSTDIIQLFEKQGFGIISTLDKAGRIHCSVKGIVGIEKDGKVYVMDLYKETTFKNIQRNPIVSITAVDDNEFIGFTLKGKAKIVEREKIEDRIIKEWEDQVIQRISKRVIKNIRRARKHLSVPEALFPLPQYLIEVDVEDIVDLTPSSLKLET